MFDTLVSTSLLSVAMETHVSDSDTIDGMKKPEKSVPVHARIAESDVAAVDKAASEQPIAVSRSHMIALIIREWVQRRQSPKKLR